MNNKKRCDICNKLSEKLFCGSTIEEFICQKCLKIIKMQENNDDCNV